MEEHPLNQSARKRACEDTKHSFHTTKFFWGVQVVAMGVFIFGATLLIPENANKLVLAGYPAVGAVIGVIVGFGIIYLVIFFEAPYKQRNEARSLLLEKTPRVHLENKRELLIAINEVGRRALDVITYQGILDKQQQNNENGIKQYVEIQQYQDDALVAFRKAIEKIDGEKLIAGEPFRDIVANLTTFLYFQVLGNMQKLQIIGGEGKRIILGTQDFTIALANKINKTVKDIEELVE